MSGAITILRNAKQGYQRTYGGEVEVCCHRVTYVYHVTGVRLTEERRQRLEEEAKERARTCICEGCPMGELNCVLKGEEEVFGAWFITKD